MVLERPFESLVLGIKGYDTGEVVYTTIPFRRIYDHTPPGQGTSKRKLSPVPTSGRK